MSVKPELTRALAQHAQYREQIAKAVDAGVAAPALAHAKCDASCELGRWLLNPVIGQSGGGEQS